jgi:hypothetical protein
MKQGTQLRGKFEVHFCKQLMKAFKYLAYSQNRGTNMGEMLKMLFLIKPPPRVLNYGKVEVHMNYSTNKNLK